MEYLWTSWRMNYIKSLDDEAQACVFCVKLDAADEQEYVVFRGASCYVCLNVYPYTSGHLLIVPYQHVSSIEELDPICLQEMMVLSQRSVMALRQGFRPQGFNIGMNLGYVAGAGLPDHVHLHVVPRWKGDSNFMSVLGGTRVLPELLSESWERLRSLWDELFPSQPCE